MSASAPRRFVVGLTGGIGSGKSAAADEFARLGVTVVDTDAISHELTRTEGGAVIAIREKFGEASIDSNGAMDRRAMRDRVFGNPAARLDLEAILHPMIIDEAMRRIDMATSNYAVYVVPLLFELERFRKGVDRILVVDCSEATQVERVGRRSGLTPEEVHRIMGAQVSRATRLAGADDVVVNDGDLPALIERVRELHLRYGALGATPGRRLSPETSG